MVVVVCTTDGWGKCATIKMYFITPHRFAFVIQASDGQMPLRSILMNSVFAKRSRAIFLAATVKRKWGSIQNDMYVLLTCVTPGVLLRVIGSYWELLRVIESY